MDYSKLTPLLVEAVKALHAENQALREKLDLKDKEFVQFKARLERLEGKSFINHELQE